MEHDGGVVRIDAACDIEGVHRLIESADACKVTPLYICAIKLFGRSSAADVARAVLPER